MTKKKSSRLPIQKKQNQEDGLLLMPGWDKDKLWHQRSSDEVPFAERKTLPLKESKIHFLSNALS